MGINLSSLLARSAAASAALFLSTSAALASTGATPPVFLHRSGFAAALPVWAAQMYTVALICMMSLAVFFTLTRKITPRSRHPASVTAFGLSLAIAAFGMYFLPGGALGSLIQAAALSASLVIFLMAKSTTKPEEITGVGIGLAVAAASAHVVASGLTAAIMVISGISVFVISHYRSLNNDSRSVSNLRIE